MSTRKGIISILIGASTSLIGTIFQFILMYLLIKSYGSQLNGFIKNSIAIVAFLGSVEGGLGAFTVIFLVKPILQKDWIKSNEMINTAKHQYKIAGYIGIILLSVIAIVYSTYTFFFEKNFTILFENKETAFPLWKMILIILTIGSKNLIALFWTACYENLMQADQNNHMRRLILMICDLISYSIIFYLISIAVDPVFVFLIFLIYSGMKGVLVYLFVRLHYPWVRIIRQKDNMQLVKSSAIVILKNIGESLILNGDVILVALLLGLRISSTLSLYMTITVGVRSIMVILINSFKEFFAAWTAKNGRIDWKSYIKFETYAFMIGAFLFVNQFILSPYFVTALYEPQLFAQQTTWTEAEINIYQNIFYRPTFSLLVALSSVFIVLAEPANVLVYAKGNYKRTSIPIFVLGLINILICLPVALISRFVFDNSSAALYGILIVTCLVSLVRFLYLWFYNWLYLTYNSSFKGVFQNWMILLVPIIVAILINYLFLTKNYNPDLIYSRNDNDGSVIVNWGWQKLLNIFFGLIFASLLLIFVNSVIWAPSSVRGIFLRLPIVYKLWTKRQEKMRKLRQEEYEDDFITLNEPEDPYKKVWEREENLQQNQRQLVDEEPTKEIYKLKG